MSGEGTPHPVISNPHEYAIAAMRYELPEGSEPYLDLVLKRDSEIKHLRFWSPRDLEIEKGFPVPTRGMEILDVTERQLENLGVLVRDFEGNWGAITFWAREVVELQEERAD